MSRPNSQHGYILLPVVILLTLVAGVAFMVNHESALDSGITSSQLEPKQAEYVARAGLNHGLWLARQQGCGPYTDLSNQPLDNHSYTTTLTSGLGGTTAYTLAVDQDTWIRSDQPTDNKATDGQLHIRYQTGIIERPMYRYDVSPIPVGASILSATAWFYVSAPHPEGPVDIHLLNTDWTETDATWDSMGANMDPEVQATIPAQPAVGAWVPVNLTAPVQAWVNGSPNFGITLNSVSEGTHGDYASIESAQQPYLEVIVGTPVSSAEKLKSKATLASGLTRTINRQKVGLYQQPSHGMLQHSTAKDAVLSYWYDTKNYGDYRLRVTSPGSSPRHSLIQFDLAAIPVGARLISAQLQLYHTVTETPGTDAAVSVHRVTRDWVEGTQGGSGSADGATWLTWDSTNPWTMAGGDHDPAVVASSPITDAIGDWESWDITAPVRDWLDGRVVNHGLLLKGSGTVAVSFASREDADPALHPKLSITYACACGSPCLVPQGGGTVVMVVVNPTTLVPADVYKKALFESWGYTVTVIGESANQATYDTAIAAADVVFISETVNANQVGTKLKDMTIGVVSQDGIYNDDLGIASGSTFRVASAINVTDTSHYITWPFVTGSLQIYDAAMEGLGVSGTEAAGLQTLADWNGVGTLATLDTGAALAGGGTAPGRRVMLPFGRDSRFNWDYLNANGRLLMHRALRWGIGDSLAAVMCEADYMPTFEVGQFATDSFGLTDPSATTYFPEGLVFDGVTSPAGGAWISSDYTSGILYMTDTGGTLLHSLASGMSDVSGVTLVTGGAFADHLALSDQVARTVDFLTLDGAPAGAFSTSSFGANEPSGVAYIGSTATGVYDDMLAVTSNADDSVSIVNQTGALQTAFTMTVPGGEKVTDVAHLPGADKLLVAFDTIQRIYDFDGNQLREYSTSSFGASKVRGAAIQPLTCEHVIVDKDLTEVKYLDQGASLLSVLQVVGDAAALDSRDAGRKALMEAWGYTVNVIDDSDSQASFDAASVAADVVLVTGSVVGATFGSKLTSSTTGVVNELPDTLDDFGFSSSTTAAVNADGFTITDGAHYITEPFSGNPVTVFTASMLMSMPSGVLAPDLQNAGEITGNAALVTLDTGALRYDNTASPSRRVHLPFSAAETSELNADAESVLQRALEWAAGAGGGGGSGSGPAGVVFEEFTDAKANAAQNLTISKPPGTVAGDLLITAVVTDGGTSSAMNPPSGWNLIDLDETGSSVTFGVWWKLATASESGSYTFSWDGGEKVFGMVMRFSGHDPVNPIHASSSDGGNSSAPAVPAVTTTVADAMILRLGGFDDDDVTVGAPGLAGHTAITMDISGNGSGTSSAGAGYTTQAVPGSSGTASFTLTASEQYRTVTIAIAPAP